MINSRQNGGEASKEKGRLPIAVIFGGRGCERAVSMVSAANIIALMEDAEIPFLCIGIKADGGFYIYSGEQDNIRSGRWEHDSKNLLAAYPGRGVNGNGGFYSEKGFTPVLGAVPIIHGEGGEDGGVQGALAFASIPYVGPDSPRGSVGTDKALCKMLASYVGIPVVPFVLFVEDKNMQPLRMAPPDVCFTACEAYERAISKFGFPMFVKPSCLGSSVGAAIARDKEELTRAIGEASALGGGRVLIEKCILSPRELEVAYFESAERRIISEPAEIITGGRFYDYETKYLSQGKAELKTVAELPQGVAEKIKGYALALCAILSVRHTARVDFFLDGEGEIYFNEINTIPGMTEGSLYLKMLSASGLDSLGFVREIASLLREGRI